MKYSPFDPERVEARRRRFRAIPVRMLLPNMITLLALCAGLTGIRLAFEGKLEFALAAIVFAAALDGIGLAHLMYEDAIAQIKEAVGELTNVKRIIRLEGTMGVDESYKDHPKCLNGASDLINEAFQEKGRHTRMIYTNPVMPLDCTSLVVLYAEI